MKTRHDQKLTKMRIFSRQPRPKNPVSMSAWALVRLEGPQMLYGLHKVNKSYLLITTKAERSGGHVILGFANGRRTTDVGLAQSEQKLFIDHN